MSLRLSSSTREKEEAQQLTRKHLKISCSELVKSSLRSILMAVGSFREMKWEHWLGGLRELYAI